MYLYIILRRNNTAVGWQELVKLLLALPKGRNKDRSLKMRWLVEYK